MDIVLECLDKMIDSIPEKDFKEDVFLEAAYNVFCINAQEKNISKLVEHCERLFEWKINDVVKSIVDNTEEFMKNNTPISNTEGRPNFNALSTGIDNGLNGEPEDSINDDFTNNVINRAFEVLRRKYPNGFDSNKKGFFAKKDPRNIWKVGDLRRATDNNTIASLVNCARGPLLRLKNELTNNPQLTHQIAIDRATRNAGALAANAPAIRQSINRIKR